LLFLTPSALSAAVSEYHAVANGRDTPDSGHDGNHFGRPLDGRNAPQADIRVDAKRIDVTSVMKFLVLLTGILQ